MMQIREIERKDNPFIEQIIKSSLESFHLNIPGTAYFDPYLGELAQFYQHENKAKYWVVVNEQDEAVGGVGIGPFGDYEDVCEVQKLYVAPEYQGQGLAKKLMGTALQFAREYYTYCYLETFEKLTAANRLYEKLGFEKQEQPLVGSEHNACDTWYMKKLESL